MEAKFASKLDLVVPVTARFATEGRHDDFFEHGNLGVHEPSLTLLLALHAQGLNDIAGDSLVQIDKHLGKVFAWGKL